MRGRRPVVKHVSEVSIAFLATHLITDQAEGCVCPDVDILFRQRRPEARPPCARFKLGGRTEQRISAANAAVNTLFVILPMLSGEGEFGAGSASHLKLLGRENLPPFVIGLD